jgi:thioredoxin 1
MEQQTTAKQEPFNELIQSSTPVLVDFYADWCGPCKAMNPVIKDVAKEVSGKVRVIKVDIDKSEAAAIKYNVSAVPTFILFKEGKPVWRHSGMIDKLNLLKVLDNA